MHCKEGAPEPSATAEASTATSAALETQEPHCPRRNCHGPNRDECIKRLPVARAQDLFHLCCLLPSLEDGSIQGGRRLGDERDTAEAKPSISSRAHGRVPRFPSVGCKEGSLRLAVLSML